MSKPESTPPLCTDTRECFGIYYMYGGFRGCNVLKTAYEHDGDCTFCKPRAEVTNGITYPLDTNYGGRER